MVQIDIQDFEFCPGSGRACSPHGAVPWGREAWARAPAEGSTRGLGPRSARPCRAQDGRTCDRLHHPTPEGQGEKDPCPNECFPNQLPLINPLCSSSLPFSLN